MPSATEGGEPINRYVYARDLQWMPQANQEEVFAESGVAPVHDDVVIAGLLHSRQI